MRFRTLLTLTCAITAAMTLTACGSSGANGVTTKDGVTSVKVGLIPTASFYPIYVAQDRGFFKDQGLSVEVSVNSNAASVVPSVLNGQLQFGTAATPPFLTAFEKGLPIKAVVNSAGTAPSEAKDTGGILVLGSSGIKSPSDLVDKKVAVNALGSAPHVAATAILSQAGVDPSTVHFVPMPFPDMLGALQQKRVDAILPVEPFMTESLNADGVHSISALYTKVYPPGTTDTLVFASNEFTASHPDVVKKFKAAVEEANAVVAKDPQVLRDALVKYGHMPKDVAQTIHLSEYGTEFNTTGMQQMADQMVKDGFLKKALDVKSTIYQGK